MLEKIVESECILRSIIEEIKTSQLPLILYGAACIAEKVYTYIIGNNIIVDDVAVDSEYIDANNMFFDKTIISIDDVFMKYNQCNIIVGFYGMTNMKRKELLNNNIVNRVFEFDHAFIYHYGLSLEDVRKHHKGYQNTYDYLQDELSRKTLTKFINARISGKINYMTEVMQEVQYFPNNIIKITDNETFVDCGAYDGDTIKEFLKVTKGRYDKIYAFEPDIKNLEALNKNYSKYSDIEIHGAGIWSSRTILRFNANKGTASLIDIIGETTINVDTIDNIVNDNIVTYIKMDIEGAEFEALKGAENTIKKYKPKLAVCVYHKIEDLIDIPQLLKKMVPEYKLYLRQHSTNSTELVLYATID